MNPKKLTEIDFNQFSLIDDLFVIDITGNGKHIYNRDFINDIMTVFSNISKVDKKILLFVEDTYTFFVFMISASLSGKPIYIANNNKPLHIKDIITNDMVYITDSEISNLRNVIDCETELYNTSQFLNPTSSENIFGKPIFLNKDSEINFFTSGSTGKAKLIKKTINQLELEIIELAKEYGECMKDSILVSTVLHYHFYGFMFSLLMPFCFGIKTARNKISYAEILNNIVDYSKITLVSTPSFLKRVDKTSIEISPKWILFSATAVLEKNVCDSCLDIFNTDIIEIYGSTESGTIGARCQNNSLAYKKLSANTIKLSENDEIIVSSPYTNNKEIFMGDVGMLVDEDHFHLLGRNNSTVKVEGKRINLKDIDVKIQQNEAIIDSHTIMHKSKNRDQIISFVVAKNENVLGNTIKEKKDSIISYLKNYFDNILIPRKIFFLDSIPRNDIGKINGVELENIANCKNLFDEYNFNITNMHADELEALVSVPYESPYFDGHFDEFKVLAGVLQVKIAFDIYRNAFNSTSTIKSIKKLKFTNMIKPDMAVLLNIKFNKLKNSISFKFYSKDKIFSYGDIVFDE